MPPSPLETAVLGVHTLATQTEELIADVLSEHRLTGATAQALWAIDPQEEPPSMKTMAQRLFCRAPNLTFVVNQLVDRGLVERIVDPADRRSRLVVLTEEGRRTRAAVVAAALTTSPLARLPADELRRLADLLDQALEPLAD
ncbi:MarR family winged helix-turn-helix transcriptional regulator [Nocardiopsis sp. NRRL B-16309]|uniref:MarR family winged helix-turn-helix transcriptional regulator n=1 Tax=Nocardiopsis sp. NRRL B-16309 TaxID=1519494 RepID=UPI0006AEA241|nr:MarR family transcriptional regulator [Nocardiopsis sp. NRRL B-16309]KOX17352.1 DNA-binding protein [Nocardiopsis sp. NRRL B-16309]